MKIAVCGPEALKQELFSIPDIEWLNAPDADSLAGISGAEGFFYLGEDPASLSAFEWKGPLLVNAVTRTLYECGLSDSAFRINAWPGFLSRDTWEICGKQNEEIGKIMTALKKEAVFVEDRPGMVSARVLAMIINEAFFALEEKVSSEAEIDIALKLGTNYPLGPIEWGRKIGLKKIVELLQTLQEQELMYKPGDKLVQEAQDL